MRDRARPGAARERALHTREVRVLTQSKQRHARTFRNREFKIAGSRITNEHFADEVHSCSAIENLAAARLPIARWSE